MTVFDLAAERAKRERARHRVQPFGVFASFNSIELPRAPDRYAIERVLTSSGERVTLSGGVDLYQVVSSRGYARLARPCSWGSMQHDGCDVIDCSFQFLCRRDKPGALFAPEPFDVDELVPVVSVLVAMGLEPMPYETTAAFWRVVGSLDGWRRYTEENGRRTR